MGILLLVKLLTFSTILANGSTGLPPTEKYFLVCDISYGDFLDGLRWPKYFKYYILLRGDIVHLNHGL